MGTNPDDPLLSIEELRTHIRTQGETVRAVDGVSFDVASGETVCLVGESGSGKSVTCESLTGIVPRPPAEIVRGSISFDGLPLADLPESDLCQIRGDRIAHVFQNPQSALDPVYTVGDQVVEAIKLHRDVGSDVARERAIDHLRRVGIPRAEERVDDYPHKFSGGMRQRVAIAIALAPDPDLLIADEPTTAVDVTVQAQLIELLRDLTGSGLSILLVTHDLRVVASLADRVLVMYGGTIVERGPVEELFDNPAHPYTRALFESYDGIAREERSVRGEIPSDGCRFRRECPYSIEACAGDGQPEFYPIGGRQSHRASCVYYAPERDPTPIVEDGRGNSLAEIETETRGSDDD